MEVSKCSTLYDAYQTQSSRLAQSGQSIWIDSLTIDMEKENHASARSFVPKSRILHYLADVHSMMTLFGEAEVQLDRNPEWDRTVLHCGAGEKGESPLTCCDYRRHTREVPFSRSSRRSKHKLARLGIAVLLVEPLWLLQNYASSRQLGQTVEVQSARHSKLGQGQFVGSLGGLLDVFAIMQPRWARHPSPVILLATTMTVTCLLFKYHELNHTDRHQRPFLAISLMCWPVVVLLYGADILCSCLVVLPLAVLGGLLASDAFHSCFYSDEPDRAIEEKADLIPEDTDVERSKN